MVRSIQPEWIAGPVPPLRAQEHINGIYAGYVIEKQHEKKSWQQAFRKPWEIGRHRKNFCGQIRTSRTDDHEYVHYLPGIEARDHHLKCIDDTEAWSARMRLNDYVNGMLKKYAELKKKRHYFDTLKRHNEEQQVLWSKAEKRPLRLAYIPDEDVVENAPRTRDLIPEFNPQKHFEDYIKHVRIEITKAAGYFYPQYVNLPTLARYLADLDSVKRGLLAELKNMSGKVPKLPTGKMSNPVVELELNDLSKDSKAAAGELLDIPKFESRLSEILAALKRKKALQPVIAQEGSIQGGDSE